MIYLKHPDHGIKVAYLESEIAADKKNGWTEMDMEEQSEVTGLNPGVAAVADSIEARYEKKYGKRPHHKMKRETIEAALNDG
jgi:hypothetical protein